MTTIQLLIQLLIVILAATRLTNMVVFESGPANIFGRLRDRFSQGGDGSLTEYLSCPKCFSISAMAIMLLLVNTPYINYVPTIFAGSQVMILGMYLIEQVEQVNQLLQSITIKNAS